MKLPIRFLLPVSVLIIGQHGAAQIDSSLIRRAPRDTVRHTLNVDAVYDRAFLKIAKLPISLGGYVEANWQHVGTDGVSEGHQFQFKRITLFLSSSISERMKFLSEIEFEDGAREISIEFAALDIEIDPLLVLRGGMILNPIGAFNQNHDGPKWEFIDRPIAATRLLPATWSNAGFGVYGRRYSDTWNAGYEFYVSGGFDDSIIQNAEDRTFLPAAKENPDRFEESASGEPLITAKVAVGSDALGEIGLSFMGGVYNTYQDDGVSVDMKRRCDVFAVDYNTRLPKIDTRIVGEWAWVFVEVPDTYSQQFGSKQNGGFVDIVQPVVRGEFLGWPTAVLNIACRLEYVDWNVGTFRETGGSIADDVWSVIPAISFRPTEQTVIRLNYRYQRQHDLLGNPPSTTAGFSFGISTYF